MKCTQFSIRAHNYEEIPLRTYTFVCICMCVVYELYVFYTFYFCDGNSSPISAIYVFVSSTLLSLDLLLLNSSMSFYKPKYFCVIKTFEMAHIRFDDRCYTFPFP